MKTSSKGINFIKGFEKLKLVGYLPTPNDIPTIGWGSTTFKGKPVKLGQKITKEEADQQFSSDLAVFEKAVNKFVTAPVTQSQYDALVSLTYNIGATNFMKSTLLKKLNQNDYDGAAHEFLRWTKQDGEFLQGLYNRRMAEKKLFDSEDL